MSGVLANYTVLVTRLGDLGKPEISNVWFEHLIQQDIAGLDIAVQYQPLASMVKVLKPFGSTQSDLVPRLPVQLKLLTCVEPVPKAPVGEEFVDQHV
ncbi:hypothetical protein QJS04_geneDACA021404 [Acorus gramineus]|uniref:Uncharacterized protein n=1 Tax=Acorus gramineus TaxID=55184 RepID=A0AAV9A622_ACOGR|nr:hypothetical protein QJS04_geneDACA021404 [Acorus gramineus]